MKASFLDLRHKSGEILAALERNEKVVISYRGRPKAVMHPVGGNESEVPRSMDHPAFGLWADRVEMRDPSTYVRELRRGRDHGF